MLKVCFYILPEVNAWRTHKSVRIAVTASTAGKAAHTPVTPNKAANANKMGGMAATPRTSEMAKPMAVWSEALKNAADTIFSPAHQKPRK